MIQVCVRCGDVVYEDEEDLEDFEDVIPCVCDYCLDELGYSFELGEFDWLGDLQVQSFMHEEAVVLDCFDVM